MRWPSRRVVPATGINKHAVDAYADLRRVAPAIGHLHGSAADKRHTRFNQDAGAEHSNGDAGGDQHANAPAAQRHARRELDADRDGYAKCDAGGDRHADGGTAKRHRQHAPNPDADEYCDADTNADQDADVHTLHPAAGRWADADQDADPHPDADDHTYRNGYRDRHGHPDRDTDRDAIGNPGTSGI